MGDYSITFARSARKELECLPNLQVEKIFLKIENLGIEPRPSGCVKLRGSSDLWRIRIGNYRVIYSVNDNDKSLDITAVRHRSQAYD